jgi:AraC-like DNA-binding protein
MKSNEDFTPTVSDYLPGNAFRVYCVESAAQKSIPYSRRDYYKITLIVRPCQLHYADKGIVIDRAALVFSNPRVPYAFEPMPDAKPFMEMQRGYFCLFTDAFLKSNDRMESIQESPLFKIGAYPVFFPEPEQLEYIVSLYERMVLEMESDYLHKYDLVRNFVNLLMHEALKMQPSNAYFKHQNASARISGLFLELLERQFPIDSPQQVLQLRTARDYASNLSVHVNHLNHAVREVTGKPTTLHITDRIVNEAKALLLHTDWSIGQISYSLGFQYPTYFNNFFKKKTGSTPLSFRK